MEHSTHPEQVFSPVEGVIFDMDGLMIDSERVTFEGYQILCAKEGKTMDKDTYQLCLGKPVPDILQVFYDAYGQDFPIERIIKENHQRMAAVFETEGVPAKPGLRQLLEFLKSNGIRTAVATSSTRERVSRILQLADLEKDFDAVVCGDEVKHGKPAPDIFLKAADALHLPPQSCLVLEDSESGIQAARSASIPVLCIPDMKQPEPAYAAMTEKILPSLHEVISWIQTHKQSHE